MALCLSTVSDASRMVVAIRFGVCMFRMFSNSAPGMFLKYDSTRRVGNLACAA